MNKKLQNMLEEQLTKNLHLGQVGGVGAGPQGGGAWPSSGLASDHAPSSPPSRTWRRCPRSWQGSARSGRLPPEGRGLCPTGGGASPRPAPPSCRPRLPPRARAGWRGVLLL